MIDLNLCVFMWTDAGTCGPDTVPTSTQCKQMASGLGYQFGGDREAGHFPSGCVFSDGKAYYNTYVSSTVVCSIEKKCLCKRPSVMYNTQSTAISCSVTANCLCLDARPVDILKKSARYSIYLRKNL